MGNQQEAAEQLFGEALDLSADERRDFLDRACRSQPNCADVWMLFSRSMTACTAFSPNPH